MRVGAMQKMPCSDLLEPRCGAITGFPAQLFAEMHEFMLEDSLQGFQAVGARLPADTDRTILLAESVKEQAAGDGDLVAWI
jgi:hypothetical protein